MESHSTWATAVLNALHGYQQQDYLCDFTLFSTDGSSLQVHSCVLAAATPSLYDESCNSKHASKTARKKTLDCSKHELQALVNYLYTGVLDMQSCGSDETSNLLSILHISSADDADGSSDGQTGVNKQSEDQFQGIYVQKEVPEISDSVGTSTPAETVVTDQT